MSPPATFSATRWATIRPGAGSEKYIEKGELVPDEVTVGMLRNKVDTNLDVEGYIFDGFPRTVPRLMRWITCWRRTAMK